MSARDTALSVLIACRRQNAWSDGALKQQMIKDGLDRRDAALATRLCFGVLQNMLLLDDWISAFLEVKPSAVQPVVTDILRLAVYQLQFMDKIPASAAVNEAVKQTRRLANPRAAGMVNGVLRNMLRHPERLALPEDLSLRYSHPPELVELLRKNVGDNKLEALLKSHNSAPDTYIQINTLRATAAAAAESLREDGLSVSQHPWLSNCLRISGGGIESSKAFGSGMFYVQDPAARLAVAAADIRPGMRVLDCCAAPGGKSFSAAIDLENDGSICSCDIHPHKIDLIRKGADRLGLSCITASVQDASVVREDQLSKNDVVIADVPCSGLGVIRKKPDIRYKDLGMLSALPEIQARILDAQAHHVRPGGILLYSTCTILRRENEDVVSGFLSRHPEFFAESFSLPDGIFAENGMITLLPCDHDTDGFFIARLRRRN